MNRQPELNRLIEFYQTLSIDSVQQLPEIYAVHARFKDPFNDVVGIEPIRHIFVHMFAQVHDPRFVVKTRILQGNDAFISWEFLFCMKRFSKEPQCIPGATHLRFDAAGLVVEHRDYWDAAEELYEKLPLIGSLMRLLKRAARS
jgi:hypothetical protein